MKTFVFVVLILTVVAACKEDHVTESSFDPTRYYVVAKLISGGDLGYVFTFTPGGTANVYFINTTQAFNWEFKDNHLTLLSDKKNGEIDFTIAGDKITDMTGTGNYANSKDILQQASLQKIPSADGFSGKTFHLNVSGQPITVKFGTSKDVIVTFPDNSTGGTYNLINNGIGEMVSKDRLFFFLLDGNLVL